MNNKSPDIQLSYMDLQRLSGYEKPKRKCWTTFNRETKEIAKVVSANIQIACYWLKWDIRVCDISEPASIQAPYGIIYKKPLRIRKDIERIK